MHIVDLEIENFLGIRRVALTGLPSLVVLVGRNGAGKSSVLDAIRFIKSCYGSYEQDELSHFFSEFQAQQSSSPIEQIARDASKRVLVRAEFRITDGERNFLRENVIDLLADRAAQQRGAAGAPIADVARAAERIRNDVRLRGEAERLKERFARALDGPLTAEYTYIDGRSTRKDNLALETIMSLYRPGELGVIDFHGAHRAYQREGEGRVRKDHGATQRRRQQALYNHANKYQGLRAELSSVYLTAILQQHTTLADLRTPLGSAIEALIETFLPGKRFEGPTVTDDGRLLFPIRTPDGGVHDIGELSSGERELVLGYLRLLGEGLHNSIIVIDEPELHLHQAVSRSLPAFYQDTLIREGNNQLWLSSHCESLVRAAKLLPGAAIVALEVPRPGREQATVIGEQDEFERAMQDLVGIAYRSKRTVVLLEGLGDEFDKTMVASLFPDLVSDLNLVSVGSKNRVRTIVEHLSKVSKEAHLERAFVAIVDRDLSVGDARDARTMTWDVFHVENYLLEPAFVLAVMRNALQNACPFKTEDDVDAALREIAASMIDAFVCEQVEEFVDATLKRLLPRGISRKSANIAGDLYLAAGAVKERLDGALSASLSEFALREREEQLRAELRGSLNDGGWRKRFRGRDILDRFGSKYEKSLKGPVFRNLILSAMRDAGFCPIGMAAVLRKVASFGR